MGVPGTTADSAFPRSCGNKPGTPNSPSVGGTGFRREVLDFRSVPGTVALAAVDGLPALVVFDEVVAPRADEGLADARPVEALALAPRALVADTFLADDADVFFSAPTRVDADAFRPADELAAGLRAADVTFRAVDCFFTAADFVAVGARAVVVRFAAADFFPAMAFPATLAFLAGVLPGAAFRDAGVFFATALFFDTVARELLPGAAFFAATREPAAAERVLPADFLLGAAFLAGVDAFLPAAARAPPVLFFAAARVAAGLARLDALGPARLTVAIITSSMRGRDVRQGQG